MSVSTGKLDGRFWTERDEDGDCTRCGIAWTEEEISGSEKHECPAGFWKRAATPKPEGDAPNKPSEGTGR